MASLLDVLMNSFTSVSSSFSPSYIYSGNKNVLNVSGRNRTGVNQVYVSDVVLRKKNRRRSSLVEEREPNYIRMKDSLIQ